MKLYYTSGACSLAIRIVIHEIGIKSEFEAVDLRTKKTAKGDDFLKINPKGAVPTIITDDNEVLTENGTIQQYLADKYKANSLLPLLNDFKRYRVLEWINYIATELHKGFGPLFNPSFPPEIKDNVVIPLLKKKLDYVQQQLGNKRFLLGDEFTLPDAYMCVMLLWCGNFKIDIAQWPKLSQYFAAIKQRKSVSQAFKEESLTV